jgi:hypothetical protein
LVISTGISLKSSFLVETLTAPYTFPIVTGKALSYKRFGGYGFPSDVLTLQHFIGSHAFDKGPTTGYLQPPYAYAIISERHAQNEDAKIHLLQFSTPYFGTFYGAEVINDKFIGQISGVMSSCGMAMSFNGNNLQISYDNGDLRVYTMTTPYDVSTASQTANVSVTLPVADDRDFQMIMNPPGNMVYYLSRNDFGRRSASISAPWDISTMSNFSSPTFYDYFSGFLRLDLPFIDDNGLIGETIVSDDTGISFYNFTGKCISPFTDGNSQITSSGYRIWGSGRDGKQSSDIGPLFSASLSPSNIYFYPYSSGSIGDYNGMFGDILTLPSHYGAIAYVEPSDFPNEGDRATIHAPAPADVTYTQSLFSIGNYTQTTKTINYDGIQLKGPFRHRVPVSVTISSGGDGKTMYLKVDDGNIGQGDSSSPFIPNMVGQLEKLVGGGSAISTISFSQAKFPITSPVNRDFVWYTLTVYGFPSYGTGAMAYPLYFRFGTGVEAFPKREGFRLNISGTGVTHYSLNGLWPIPLTENLRLNSEVDGEVGFLFGKVQIGLLRANGRRNLTTSDLDAIVYNSEIFGKLNDTGSPSRCWKCAGYALVQKGYEITTKDIKIGMGAGINTYADLFVTLTKTEPYQIL